jgi:hypothetical protein
VASSITFKAVPILIDGHDTHGLLALLDGQLVAVLSRLDGEAHDPELKGSWHLEAGFGPCPASGAIFRTHDEIAQWVRQRGASRSYPQPIGNSEHDQDARGDD